MSIELRPLGVACNLSCHYCYQNPQRDAGNQRMTYDLEKMKKEAARIGGSFTLFGGEPLLMRFEDLENLFAWGLETFGRNAIQTNGVLIEDRHIDLFRRFKVSVGISIDGPGELNDARWHWNQEKTRQSTAAVEAAIERLCREYQPPGLIITLHRGNASAEKLPAMTAWMRRLHEIGIRGVRLHLLEVDHASVRDSLALSPKENIDALLAFAEVQESLPGMHFDLFDEMEALLDGRDKDVGCTWRACDPYTTEAVQGVEGNGQSSNCGRTNKEGIGFIKAESAGYERYLALYRTPQSENGCAGCRFFLMCKGQCPGTAIDGDWRNRTEHCEEWKHLFGIMERRMIRAGKIPITIQPLRLELEQRQIEAWQRGLNPSLNRMIGIRDGESSGPLAKAKPRISWVSQMARERWEPRLNRLQEFIEQTTFPMLDLPSCCRLHGQGAGKEHRFSSCNGTVILSEGVPSHPLLAPLGLSVLPIEPCRFDCPEALEWVERWLSLAGSRGCAEEVEWLREFWSWSVEWSELHGVTEVKTPLFKMCFLTDRGSPARTIRRIGKSSVEGSPTGLRFPYTAPPRDFRLVAIGRGA